MISCFWLHIFVGTCKITPTSNEELIGLTLWNFPSMFNDFILYDTYGTIIAVGQPNIFYECNVIWITCQKRQVIVHFIQIFCRPYMYVDSLLPLEFKPFKTCLLLRYFIWKVNVCSIIYTYTWFGTSYLIC